MKKKKIIRNKGEVMDYLDTNDEILDHRVASVITEDEHSKIKSTCDLVGFGYSQMLRFFMKYGLAKLHGESVTDFDNSFDKLSLRLNASTRARLENTKKLVYHLPADERKKLLEELSKP